MRSVLAVQLVLLVYLYSRRGSRALVLLTTVEQEVVDRVIRRKLQREYGGLRLESTPFRQFLTALGESAVKGGKKGRGSKDRADAGEFGDESD